VGSRLGEGKRKEDKLKGELKGDSWMVIIREGSIKGSAGVAAV
jgi:hypothetical protein